MRTSPLHIAIFCHNYPPHIGGLEVVVQEMAHRLARRHRVTVLTTSSETAPGRSSEGDVVVWRVPAIRPLDRLGVPFPIPTGRYVAAALKEINKCDVLHAHGSLYPTTLMASLVSRIYGKPLVLTEHVGVVPYGSRALRLLQNLAWWTVAPISIRPAGTLLALNSRVQAFLSARYPTKRVALTFNGVDPSVFRPYSREERLAVRDRLNMPRDLSVVLLVARQSDKKNVPTVVSVPRHDFALAVCGAQRDLHGPNLIDLGLVPHRCMPDVYASADVLVHAGEGEGFPVAVQEAMACGLPVVMRRDPGYGSAVPIHALRLYDAGDEEVALTSLLGDSRLRENLSRLAREHAEECWSWDSVVAAHVALYQQLMESAA